MNKFYPPKNIIYRASQDTEVIFSIEFISDGNFGSTFINLPGDEHDKLMYDEGEYNLGKIENLTAERTVIVSNFSNPIPEELEDKISVLYKLNDKEIPHENFKSEADDAIIPLIINFEVS